MASHALRLHFAVVGDFFLGRGRHIHHGALILKPPGICSTVQGGGKRRDVIVDRHGVFWGGLELPGMIIDRSASRLWRLPPRSIVRLTLRVASQCVQSTRAWYQPSPLRCPRPFALCLPSSAQVAALGLPVLACTKR